MSLTPGWPETPDALPSPVVDNHCHLDHRAYSKALPGGGGEGGLLIPVDEALATGEWPWDPRHLETAVRRGYEQLPRSQKRLPLI